MFVYQVFSFLFWKIILVLVASQCISNSYAENIKPIQFLKVFNQTKDTSGLYKNLQKLENNVDYYNEPELIAELLKSGELAEELNAVQLSQIYFITKKYYDENGNKAMSFEYALKIYRLLIKTKKDKNLIWILIDLGNIFFSQNDYQNAKTFYRKAERIAVIEKQQHALSVIYLNYGLLYTKRGMYQEALKSMRISNSFRLKFDNHKVISFNYVRIAEIYLKMGKTDSCLFSLRQAKYFYKNRGTPTSKLVSIPNMIDLTYAKYFLFRKEYNKAILYVLKAKKYSKERLLVAAYIEDVVVEADIYFAQKKYDEAIAVLEQLMFFLEENKINDEKTPIYKKLGSIYLAKGDWVNARKAYSSYIQLHKLWDNANIKSKLNVIRSLSEMYESDAKIWKAKEKFEIQKMNDQLNQDEKSTSIVIIAVSAVAFLVVLVLFLTQIHSRRRLKLLHQQMVGQNLEMELNSKELEKSNYLKDKLFSIIAHDLRNPLNRMLVELAILKKTTQNDSPIRQMEVNLKEIIELFEGLLQWSKLDGNKNIYHPKKINLKDSINKTLKFYEHEIEHKNIRVIQNLEINFVFADLNIIEILFKNLISNGILFVTKSANERVIEIKSKEVNSKMVEIYISNSGPQFSPELIAEFYTQDENIISKSSGLGLSICKLLSKLCGWKIEIGNKDDEQLAYLTIEIPKAENQEEINVLLPSKWVIDQETKQQLLAFKEFKFYQLSQIRSLLKKFIFTEDEHIKAWTMLVDNAVNEGNEHAYIELISLLDN